MDMVRNNLALMASLRVMLDERNITRAAARMGISQPALSAQLARLRDLFGDQLLTPSTSGKGMILTPRGAELQEPLRKALLTLEDVVSKPPAFDPTCFDRTFTIGANDNASAIMATRLIRVLRRGKLNSIRLAFRSIDFGRLSTQLENGELDVALVPKSALSASMPHKALLEEDFMMAQRKDHPRGARRPSIKQFAALEHIIVSGDGGGFRGFIDDILSEQGLTRRVGVSVQYYSIVPLILQSTDLVCTLPARFLSCYSDKLAALPLPFDAHRFSLYASWHARFDNDPAHAWLRQQLTACAAD
jgi:DNA-binding transcriptional LysR family regulator